MNDELVCVRHAHRPANPLLDFLSVTHVHEATAGESVNGMYSLEFGVIDVARDEVSDDCRHSVCHGRAINMVLNSGGKEKRTLGI